MAPKKTEARVIRHQKNTELTVNRHQRRQAWGYGPKKKKKQKKEER